MSTDAALDPLSRQLAAAMALEDYVQGARRLYLLGRELMYRSAYLPEVLELGPDSNQSKVSDAVTRSVPYIITPADARASMEYAAAAYYEALTPAERDAEHTRTYLGQTQSGTLDTLPEALPFEAVWIAMGNGFSYAQHTNKHARLPEPTEFVRVAIVVDLKHQLVVDVRFQYDTDTRGGQFIMCNELLYTLEHSDAVSNWIHPVYNRWVHYLVQQLSQGTKTAVTPGVRKDWMARVKANMVRGYPPPYYVVPLQHQVVPQTVAEAESVADTARRSLTYQHSVRAHECCKVIRGKGDIPPKLLLRRYRFYKHGDTISETDRARLQDRNELPPDSPGEWIGILTWWRASHVRGPEDAPFIPSARFGVLEQEEES